jgi:hypothetical protein
VCGHADQFHLWPRKFPDSSFGNEKNNILADSIACHQRQPQERILEIRSSFFPVSRKQKRFLFFCLIILSLP